jgi:hypothetical protein
MSCFDVKILDPNINTIEIETCIGDQPASIDIVTYDNNSVIEINSCLTALDVEGLITVKDILAGSGINVVSNNKIYTISLLNPTIPATGIIDLLEAVQDIIGNSGLLAGNYININYDDNTGFTTITATGLQPIGNYANAVHSHVVNDITNFNSGVSGLLPSVSGSGYIYSNFNNNIYTISVSGLQPSGNYSIVGHQHLISDVSGLQIALDNKQPSGDYAPLIHNHISSDITDFNSSVSGLLPSVSGSGYVNSSFNDNIYIISVTGLQPSGNYSIIGHTHTSSDITDFNSSVSGLLTPYALLNSPNFSGIPTVPTASSGTNTTQIASTAFVRTEISNLIDSAPITLDTLNELAAALGDDPNFATTVTNLIGGKVSKSGDTMTGTLNAPSGVFSSGLTLNGITVSVSGHTHTSSDITNFNSSVSGLLPVIANSGNNRVLTSDGTSTGINAESYLTFDNNTATLNVGSSGMDNNSSNINLYGRNSDDQQVGITIKDSNNNIQAEFYWNGDEDSTVLASYVDKLRLSAPVFDGGVYVSNDFLDMGGDSSSGIYISTTNNLFVNNIPVSVSGHTHSSSDITNFNSSVSGLLPVKDILAGSGILVSSTSGNYTISANISGTIIETIQDNFANEFLIAGTGVQLNYNDSANTLTLNNLHTEINELSLEPQGFVNRLDSTISFNDSTRTFTIAPTGTSYDVYIEGVKVTKTISESIVIPTGTALNYLHFNTDTGLLDNKTTGFNFDTDLPIAFIHWNSDINQSTFFGEERHGIRMDSSTHKWIHNTFGMQYVNGLSIGGYTLLGNGSSNSHAQINISDGTLYQEDIIINIADGNNGVEFTQQLSPIAYIPVYYHLGTTGQWVRDVSTPYPLKYNATRALYNLYSGGTWTTPNVTNNRYFAMWIVATNDISDPILAIMGQREDSSLGSAENNNIWSDIDLTNIPTNELRPLYRLIFVTNDTFTNTPKSSLQSILDLRKSILTTTYGVSQNDHGNLFGLGDDDHFQYVHINEARTISANHTFNNGLTISSGLLSATSGSFTALNVNGTGVSLNGHTHTSSNITDFNSSVSGLLPSVSGSGYVNSSFNNNVYTISVSGLQPSGNYANAVHTHSSSDITDFNTSVSGLLPSISGSGYVSSSFDNNVYTISVTGLQPSGNYSLVGHNHTSNDITDFNSSVSGLLPVTNIVGGTNVSVSASGTVYTISASGTGTTITNASDNRVLTSTGTSTGINAENNLTFDGTNLVITGNIGIGTGVLSEKLEVAGNIKANNIIHPFLLGGM